MDREELKRLTKEEISRRIREGVKAVIGQVLRMFRWALLPGNARETWGRDLVADLPAVYPLGPQPHSEPGLAQDGRGRAIEVAREGILFSC